MADNQNSNVAIWVIVIIVVLVVIGLIFYFTKNTTNGELNTNEDTLNLDVNMPPSQTDTQQQSY